ncbi:MAG TPA: SusC/RagA family TonB-linked outer membrane protein, partial [Chitinophagaceae bacterium]
MKITAILMLVACLQVSATGYSQEITLSEKNVPLQKVFKEIRQQTGYNFLCSYDLLEQAGKVSVKVRNASLEEVLHLCFKGKPLTYTIIEKTVVVKHALMLELPSVAPLPPPPISIHGKVTDEKGQPIPGASIRVKNSNFGTVTDNNGNFSLNNVAENATILITSIGYEGKELKLNGQTSIRVELITDKTGLNEVTVVGYSTQLKKDITGAVAVVDIKSLKSIPSGSAAQALQGQASGVTIISSGVPGGRNDIFVRGVTSFGNTTPLVIVDGVQGDLDNININDIESMQVLKDAGAASIYGVRGSNGVIVITTKKGKLGAPIISYDTYMGVQLPLAGNVWNLLTPQENAAFVKQVNPGTLLYKNGIPDYTYRGPGIAGTALEGDPAVDPAKYNFDEATPGNDYLIQKLNKSGTDWFHEIFKPAMMQSHVLTGSGGTDKASYLLSFGYLNQQGTLIETFLKRYSARINTELRPGKNFRIGENFYLFYKQNPEFSNQNEYNAIAESYQTLPLIPVHDIKGNYGGTFSGPEIGDGYNPVAIQERTKNNLNNIWDVTGNIYAAVDFLKHFTARTSFGGTIDNQYSYHFYFNLYDAIAQHNSLNSFNEDAQYGSSYTWTNTLHYRNQFGRHQVTALIGSEAIKNRGRGVGGSSSNFFSTDPNYLVLNNGTTNITNYSYGYVNTLFSLFTRLDYSYSDKYLLGATIRRDGSSVFGADKRFGIFPSFSLGWRVSNERFMKGLSFVN